MTTFSDPCLGYVFREGTSPNRKLVILGDTHNPTAMKTLCINPSPELLVHEATDWSVCTFFHRWCRPPNSDTFLSCIPSHVDYKNKRTVEQVREKALARGHSIPSMAGDFAREIGAKKLVLNHISSRYDTLLQLSSFPFSDYNADFQPQIRVTLTPSEHE